MSLLSVAILIVNLLAGIVFCFFGNRWLKVVLALFGFAAGFLIGNTLLPVFTPLADTTLVIASLVMGAAGALLFVFLMYLGIFSIGFGGGLVLCLLAAQFLSLNMLEWYVFIPMLLLCCGLGALTLNNRRIFISVFTSFLGASMLAQFIDQIVVGVESEALLYYSEQATYSAYNSSVYLIALGVLFFAGLIIQLTVTSKRKP